MVRRGVAGGAVQFDLEVGRLGEGYFADHRRTLGEGAKSLVVLGVLGLLWAVASIVIKSYYKAKVQARAPSRHPWKALEPVRECSSRLRRVNASRDEAIKQSQARASRQ